MKVLCKGLVTGSGSYHSNKTGQDVSEVYITDGSTVIKVPGVEEGTYQVGTVLYVVGEAAAFDKSVFVRQAVCFETFSEAAEAWLGGGLIVRTEAPVGAS